MPDSIFGSLGALVTGAGERTVAFGSSVVETGRNFFSAAQQRVGSMLDFNSQPETKPSVSTDKKIGNLDYNPAPLTDLEDSFFNFVQLNYPTKELLSRYPYYVTFYFNVPTTRSKYNRVYKGVNSNEKGDILSVAGITAREANQQLGGSAQPESHGIEGTFINTDVTRESRRTSHSIRLYMPDTLQWNFRQQWRDPHLSDSGLVNKLAPAASVIQGYQEGGMDGLLSGAAQAAKLVASRFGEAMTGLPEGVALAKMGYTVNPLIDVIYTSPDLRTFTMEFNFAPRSPEESSQVLKIIKAFKFFSAPEVPNISGYGYLMIPPGDIDIVFSLSTVGRISTCVLQNIDLDYAPNGVAAYQNPENIEDGMPVNIRMRLEFTETEYITKDLIMRGY